MRRIYTAASSYLAIVNMAFSLLLPAISLAEDNMSNANTLQQQLQFMDQMRAQQATGGQPEINQSIMAPPSNMPRQGPPTQAQPPQNMPMQAAPVQNAPIATQQVVESSPAEIDQGAFQGVAKQLLPLSPAQIHRLRQLYDQAQYAASADPTTPPQPAASTRYVSLAPGATPPVIRLGAGFVTSMVFLDSSGAPWPIESYDLGNPAAFDIQWNKKDNILMVQAKSYYTYGNIAVRLKGKDANTPVMITLIPGQQSIDYRVDLRIQGLGPNAAMPTGDGLPGRPNPELLNVLDGVPPAGSVRLNVTGGDAEAWLKDDKLFVRTRLTILSPSWIANMASADGTRAYEMQRTPLILASNQGKIMQLKIEGF